ncbi:MAG TPA: N(4)-(beta-N-acetylglucosaminyl)-L-asparaginase [Bacteroidota bacterium]|nr:N(4)-(beta-N-acetylglucosaminyl)-L-asparaginase [Bacteroidota bacterium]
MKRQEFLRKVTAAGAVAAMVPAERLMAFGGTGSPPPPASGTGPIALHTWNFNQPVNQTAVRTLEEGGSLLDALERGIALVEADPKITSVGRGGFPDRDGHLTLDACVMDEHGNAGSVMFLEHIMHPLAVARRVLEKTPHVILAGDGALQFAQAEGFPREDLLTDTAKKAYADWLKQSGYQPPIDRTNHDTIGMILMDRKGNMAGGCSTSGAAWKMHGRVGDSPVIGAGLYVDSDIGGATSTGLGEAVIKVAGSFLIVEAMRNGVPPQDACKMAIDRIISRQPKYKDVDNFLAGFIALNKRGEIGALSYRKGLQYSLWRDGRASVVDAEYLVK